MTGLAIALALAGPLGLPIWLGLRNGPRVDDDPRFVTSPGRLIDKGVVMDPDRLRMAVE